MKFIISILLISWMSNINGVQYNCNFKNYGSNYCCSVTSGIISVESDATVTKITGTHLQNKYNSDVICIDTRGFRTRFFPKKLNTFFPNIVELYFEDGMNEIHIEDLQQIPKLKYLYLSYNKIDYIEKDLFKYNPDLELVFLDSNIIEYVDPNVFDKLTKLRYLGFDGNHCDSGKVENNRTETLNLIKSIQKKCSTPVDDIRKKNEELELVVVELNKKIASLEATAESQVKIISDLELKAGEQEKKIQNLETTISDQSEKIISLESTNSVQNNNIKSLETANSDQSVKIISLEVKNSVQGNKIKSLETTNSDQANKINTLESVNSDQANKIISLESINANQSEKIKSIESIISEQENEIKDINLAREICMAEYQFVSTKLAGVCNGKFLC